MSDLALACGVSKAALYHYFDSKEAILHEALAEYVSGLVAIAQAHGMPDATPEIARPRLRDLIQALLAEYERSHDYHVSLLHDLKYLAAPQAAEIRAAQRQVTQVFGRLLEQSFPGRFAPKELSAAVMALLGTINFTFAWLKPDGSLSHRSFGDMVIDLWWHGLERSPLPGP